jgi:hypothetical protein
MYVERDFAVLSWFLLDRFKSISMQTHEGPRVYEHAVSIKNEMRELGDAVPKPACQIMFHSVRHLVIQHIDSSTKKQAGKEDLIHSDPRSLSNYHLKK